MQTTQVGDYIYRVQQPSVAMGRLPDVTVVTVSTISPFFRSLCLQADVLIIHLLTESMLLPIIQERKQSRRPTVYEISDDFTALQAGVGIRRWFGDPANTAAVYQLSSLCDAVQVTGDGLRQKFGFVHPRMRIFENQLASIGAFPSPREGADRITIGWAGSDGHGGDVRMIAPVIRRICADNPHVHFALMGSEAIYRDSVSGIPQRQRRHVPPGTLDDYLAFLETLDIGIAPLVDCDYNHSRSDVKFIEYASRGVFPVLSRLTPYLRTASHERNAVLFSSADELYRILERAIDDSTYRRDISRNAYDYVRQNRLIEQHAQERVNWYGSLTPAASHACVPKMPLLRLESDSEAYDVEKTRAEMLLRDGIILEASGDFASANSAYREAARCMPGYALPHFWQGTSAARQGDANGAVHHLSRAVEIDPRLLRARMELGRILERTDTAAASEAYRMCLSITPVFAPAIEAMGALVEREGSLSDAVSLYQLAGKANPCSSTAALRLGHAWRILGRESAALEALKKAVQFGRHCLDVQVQAAREYCLMNRPEDAAGCLHNAMAIDPENPSVLSLANQLKQG
jgi:tetratricopeptide (TPR) repeat protein